MHRAAYSRFERCILAVLLTCNFTILPAVPAEEGQTTTILIDDFEAKNGINLLGGASSSWTGNPNDPTVVCSASFVDVIRDDRKTSVLKLRYGLTNPDYITYYYRETQSRYKINPNAIDPLALSGTKARTKATDLETLRYYQIKLQQHYAVSKATSNKTSNKRFTARYYEKKMRRQSIVAKVAVRKTSMTLPKKNFIVAQKNVQEVNYSKYIPSSKSIDYSKAAKSDAAILRNLQVIDYHKYIQSSGKSGYSNYIPGSSGLDYSKYYKKPDYTKYIKTSGVVDYSKYYSDPEYSKYIPESSNIDYSKYYTQIDYSKYFTGLDYSKYYKKPDYTKYIKTSGVVDYSKYYTGQSGAYSRTIQEISLKFQSGSDVDYNGYYTKLNGLDLRPYQYFTFWVKRGEEAYPDLFKIELKCGPRLAIYRYRFPTSEDQWIHVNIPLADFTNFGASEKWKQASELAIVFEGDRIRPVYGVLYLDDIGFSADTEYCQRQKTLIVEETEKTRKEMHRIAALPEDELLDLIERKTFDYFWLEANPNTGLTKDRSTIGGVASVGATGFGLTAMCIGAERKWITQDEAYRRVFKTLKALRDVSAKEHGFFYHWINARTGERDGRSEVGSVDTALLIGGVLTVREYFPQPEIKQLADEIYQNLDWPWMLGDNPESGLLSMGWDPEKEFKGYIKWDMFAEELMMYLLAIASPTHPLPAKSWDAFMRPVKQAGGQTYLYHDGESMFVYTYSHAWVDFRDKHDAYADYWKNSVAAIKANYDFCKANADKFNTYKEGYWGISASDGPDGYAAFGTLLGMHNGTIPPYSLCAAVPFMPELTIPAIRSLLANYGDKVWGRYGFVSAFNLDRNWFSTEYLGIDQGDILLMLENYRSGFVWKTFMKNPYIKRGMEIAGFQPGTKELDVAFLRKLQEEREKTLDKEIKKVTAYRLKKKINIDGTIEKWDKDKLTKFDTEKDLEFGTISGPKDLAGSFGFQWDDDYLYFAIEVTDDEIVAREKKSDIYRGDCVELYLDFKTKGKNFIWGDTENFQIGLAPDCASGGPAAWAWFQEMDPKDSIKLAAKKTEEGYNMEAAIKWSFLTKEKPQPGMIFGVSVSLHDLDNSSADKKLNWYFKKFPGKIRLGEITLAE